LAAFQSKEGRDATDGSRSVYLGLALLLPAGPREADQFAQARRSMNWIKQNTFLAGFIAVMVIGVGALGYLLFSASSHYEEVRTDYAAKAKELNRLETLKPYPEAGNLKQLDEQKKE